MRTRLATTLVAALILTPLTIAFGADEPGVSVYTLEDFSASNPHTALDVIDLLPGFVVEDDADVRGLGASAGNVLIDGSHPASKGGGVRDALSRIPASKIERIEVRNTDSMPGQTSSYSAIANIVTRETPTTTSWSMSLERARSGDVYPSLEVSRAGHVRDWKFDVRAGSLLERLPGRGTLENFDADRRPLRSFDERRFSKIVDTFVSAGAGRGGGDDELKFNLRLDDQRFDPALLRLDAAVPTDGERIASESDTRKAELGGHWNKTLSPLWGLRVSGLAGTADEVFESQRFLVTGTDEQFTSAFVSDVQRTELVLRTTFVDRKERSWLARFGVEVAYNEVESELRAQRRLAFSIVDELRTELFSVWQFRLASRLTLEAEANLEHSRISVRGDADRRENLAFFKPAVLLTWTHGDRAQTRLSVRRYVSQLSFDDFAANADLVEDRETAGNAALKPDRGTRAEAEFRYEWSDRTVLTTSVYHEWQQDVLEYTLFESGLEGVANSGDATRWGVNFSGGLSLARWLPGAIVQFDVGTQDSRYFDPLTAGNRVRTGTRRPIASLRLRQDIPDRALAWGLTYFAPSTQRRFFAAERQTIERGPIVNAYVEWNRSKSLKFRFDATSLGHFEQIIDRDFFRPARGSLFVGARNAWSQSGPYFRLSVSRQF